MQPRKFRWSKVYESSEEELVQLLATRGTKALRQHVPEQSQATQAAISDEQTIWCAEGSCHVSCAGNSLSLQPGDALQVPANQPSTIDAGIAGCVYYVNRH